MNVPLVLHPHCPLSPHQPFQNRTIPRLAPHSCHMNALPVSHPSETLGVQLRASMPVPLAKGSWIATRLFLIINCNILHFINVNIRSALSVARLRDRPPTSPSPQPSQKHIHPSPHTNPSTTITPHFPVIHHPTFISSLYTLDNFRR